MLNKDLEDRILRTNDWGLLAILNEGLMDKFDESIKSIEEENYQLTEEILSLSKDIMTELIVFFNKDSEIARNFREIYLFVNKLITQGFIEKDGEYFEAAKKVIEPLVEGFNEKELSERAKVVTGLTYGPGDLDEYKNSGITFEG